MSLSDRLDELPEGIESNDVIELRRALMRVQKKLLQTKQKVDDLVEATHHAAYDAMLAMGALSPVKEPTLGKSKAKTEVALWHLTDWQGAKKTVSYDSEVMRKRVLEFAEKAVRITDIQRADHPVDEVTIMFGGDMIEGLFNFPSQAFEIDSTLFEQYVNVSRLCVDVVRLIMGASVLNAIMFLAPTILTVCAMSWQNNYSRRRKDYNGKIAPKMSNESKSETIEPCSFTAMKSVEMASLLLEP